ncbi:NAD-glutamate dehydrogenase [Motiliproteus sp. SC1-56]|uniref:NAD-glutamate dehydrogenase n=1 Tax=Motiliproteus sp. SC1-56 TaxID=2799565 RepID=UPI001A8D290D|nr:NAD-glutamate dehydrogenase [Motiliproteus sp. SC1-56]
MNTLVEIKKSGINQVKELLAERLPAESRAAAQQLAEVYYGRSHAREMAQMAIEDLYGALLCLWDLVQQRRPGKPLVRCYNPNPEDHRWHSTHTVVEVLSDDMPFLVSSINLALADAGIRLHQITHPVIRVVRDGNGRLQQVLDDTQRDERAIPEALMRLEVDHQPDAKALNALKKQVQGALNDVSRAVKDWDAMKARLEEAVAWSEAHANIAASDEAKAENIAFLRWLMEDNFLFLGFRYYHLEVQTPDRCVVNYEADSGLGTFGEPASERQRRIELTPHLSELAQRPELLVLTKSTMRSTVQRNAHLDYVGVRKIDEQGQVLGEWRFFGLYASSAYSTPLEQVPMLRHKLARLLESANLPADSHSGKSLRHLISQYPRDEMLQADYENLEQTLFGMLECEERRQLRLFLRPDSYGRFINALVLVPRDHYDTVLRLKMQDLLMETFEGHSSEFNVRLSDQALAQVQFTIHCRNAHERDLEVEALEARMVEAMTSWEDRLLQALVEKVGEASGNRIYRDFAHNLPAAYQADYSPRRAVIDLQRLADLDGEGRLSTYLYRPLEEYNSLHFKVLGRGDGLALSDLLPILEQMGVRVLNARPYRLKDREGQAYWILDFRLSVAGSFDPEDRHLKEQFQQTFVRTHLGELENDGFNALVIAAGLSWRQVLVLRACCKYLLQLGLPFSQASMERTLALHSHISRQLVQLFEARFDPHFRQPRQERQEKLVSALESALDGVDNLDEDRILRHYLSLLLAMLRTNFYQQTDEGEAKGYLSIKLDTDSIPAAPQPRPRFEIFVYAPWVEGVHLRGGKVARGGLRWSDRREDFRTEVLGLVKAQMVKNAVIVPVGAKGGFVAKQLPTSSREAVQAEVIHCYETFIRGLLDITDNRSGEDVIPPPEVVRHDEDDPYLVVAADKGTASFSDIANRISKEYGFWLGDAFASGGANGYDHKKMGITARGAWESVKRLFLERGLDTQRQDFTVVGIGDMGGDVFGNGMLLSKHIRLVAAFNHQHIFIDPEPDAARSWEERKRLFELPRSTWDDYDKTLISKGGGVYSRAAKSVELSDEARAALDIRQRRMTPTELIQHILKAPVDLLWNGGIGTYVKASTETHQQVGDRANDGLRVDGRELRVKVVGEGGNLGCTQLGRIEFARQGGLINTDAIDNAGGVDSSDHEVNLKILLDQEVAAQDMTEKQRNKLLASMTDEVAGLVLRHNRLQSQVLSLAMHQVSAHMGDHRQLIQRLEQEGRLKRKLEFLPADEQLEELARAGEGLTRPEVAVLLAYAKLALFDQLVDAGISADPDLSRELPGYFPTPIQEHYGARLQQHPLRQELLATHVTNAVLNRMGSTYINYLQQETRCSAIDAVRAFFAARDIFAIEPLWQALEAQEAELDDSLFAGLMLKIQNLLERSVLWLLRTHGQPLSVSELQGVYVTGVSDIIEQLPSLLPSEDNDAWQQQQQELVAAGLPEALVQRLSFLERAYHLLEMVRLAHQCEQPVVQAAQAYLQLERDLGLDRLRERIQALPAPDLWQRKARAALGDELDRALARAGKGVLAELGEQSVEERINQWQQAQQQALGQFRATCAEIQGQEQANLAMLSVAVRELGQLQ